MNYPEWQEYDRVHGTTVEEQLRMEGRCPILFSHAVERYGLSDNQVKVHCRDGCCPICGEILWEKYKKKLKNEIIMPIDPFYEDAILTRRKTSIIFKECKGNPGDNFSAFCRRYRLTYTHKLPLWMLAANDYYRECEGVSSPLELIAGVRRYCPDALDEDPMCIHIFREVWE